MPLPTRVHSVPVDAQILSYYKGADGHQIPLRQLIGGRLTPDTAEALLELDRAVSRDGGTLFVTDAYRDVAVQGAARRKYENWLAAGKPSPGTSKWVAATMKAAFVARPGRSFHSGARAVDLAHMVAAPASVPRSLKLDWLWERALPLGFQPILKAPDEGATEAWHFDFRGPWAHVYDALGYEQAAMCATLDIGEGEGLFAQPWERWVQAQLWRAGMDLGDIDGHWGNRTQKAAAHLDLLLDAPRQALEAALMALPDQHRVRFVA